MHKNLKILRDTLISIGQAKYAEQVDELMRPTYYRVIAPIDGKMVGIYEAVAFYCPRGDACREDKPDGSWLPKVGESFPGAESYWTEAGWDKYVESGLFDWHRSVVPSIQVLTEKDIGEIIYEDPYQVIAEPVHHTKTAIIIKGNPKWVEGPHRELADSFYSEIADFLREHEYEVGLDSGMPYTSPPNADIWIGHSRGADRLRFAPEDTKVIAFGATNRPGQRFKIVNHPNDINIVDHHKEPVSSHYVFTDEMKQELKALIGSKYAEQVDELIKRSSKSSKEKFFEKYKKLSFMADKGLGSSDEGIANEARVALARLNKLKEKFNQETGSNFDEEYHNWLSDSDSKPQGDDYDDYDDYDFSKYMDEFGDIEKMIESRIDHVVYDYIMGKLSKEQAMELLGEDDDVWLNELERETKMEMFMSGEWAAMQKETHRDPTKDMSPMEALEYEEQVAWSDWRNHIEPGVDELLYTLESDKQKEGKYLVKKNPNDIVVIQKNKYDKPTSITRKELVEPDVTPGNIWYGVTKKDYSKESMQKTFDHILKSENFNEEMDELVKSDLIEIFTSFQTDRGNSLINDLKDYLNSELESSTLMLKSLVDNSYRHINNLSRRGELRFTLPPNFEWNYDRKMNLSKHKALLRYLQEIEREVAGTPTKYYLQYLKKKYPLIYNARKIESAYNNTLNFIKSLNGLSLKEARKELSQYENNLEIAHLIKD